METVVISRETFPLKNPPRKTAEGGEFDDQQKCQNEKMALTILTQNFGQTVYMIYIICSSLFWLREFLSIIELIRSGNNFKVKNKFL